MRSTSAAAALCYGLTEAESPLTPQAARRRPGSNGRPWPGWHRSIHRSVIGVHAAYARSVCAEWALNGHAASPV